MGGTFGVPRKRKSSNCSGKEQGGCQTPVYSPEEPNQSCIVWQTAPAFNPTFLSLKLRWRSFPETCMRTPIARCDGWAFRDRWGGSARSSYLLWRVMDPRLPAFC